MERISVLEQEAATSQGTIMSLQEQQSSVNKVIEEHVAEKKKVAHCTCEGCTTNASIYLSVCVYVHMSVYIIYVSMCVFVCLSVFLRCVSCVFVFMFTVYVCLFIIYG